MSRLTRVIRDIDVTRPTTPTGLAATPVSETQINLTWNAATDPQGSATEAVSGIAGYKLYRNGVLRTTQAGLSFSDTALTAFTQYGYTVTAYDNAGNESQQSTQVLSTTLDQTAPTAPVIAASATSSSSITVSMTSVSTDAGSGVSSYTMQRATDAGFTLNLTTTAGVSFPASVTGLAASTQYFFRVRAIDGSGNTGSFSATVNATTSASTGVSGQTFAVSVEGSGTDWVTFGHPFARGVITGAPVLTTSGGGAVQHQAHVHSRHSDGSVRHAVISARPTGGQNYVIASGTAPAGTARTVADLLAAIPGDIASVTLTGGVTGLATVRDLLENATNRAKLNNTSSYYVFEQGPQMLGVVVSQDFATHLRVTMHLRWYGGTTLWCGYLFENGYVNLAGMNSKSYTAAMVLNGVTVATQAMTSPVHYNRSMWYSGGKWSAGGSLYARLRGSSWTASKCVPNYALTAPPTQSYIAARAQSFPPMTNGDYQANIDATAEQDMLGILPRWEAAYITSDCDVRMRNNVLANAGCGMAYTYSCIMDSATGEHLSVSDRPTFSAQQVGTLPSGWNSGLSPYTAIGTGTFPAHMPSVGYLAFAIAGDWAYLRAMHGWCSFTPHYSDTNRNFTFNGRTVRRFYWGSARGVGWSYRSVGQAAYITPDSHYLKTYYNDEINGTFGVDAAEFNASYSPIGLCESAEFVAFGKDHYRLFMHDFLSQSVSHLVCDMGFSTGTAFASHVAKFPAGLMGNTNEFKWNFAASYEKTVAATNGGAFYTTFTQMTNDVGNVPSYATGLAAGSQALANAMFSAGDIPTATAGSITGRPNEAGSYYANLQPAVSYLTALGITGGDSCWSRFVSGQLPDYSDKPQFNIIPRPTTALAQAAATLSAGQSLKFGTIPAAILDIDALPSGGFSPLQYMSSVVYDPINKQMRWIGRRSSTGFSYRFPIYDEVANTWSLHAPFPGADVPNGHGYDHNTIDPATGIHYFRPYNDPVVVTWNPTTNVFGTLAAMGSPPPVIAGSLEWIPGTGLVYFDRQVMWKHPGASSPGSAWTLISNTGSSANAYHGAGAYNRNSQLLLWGWGNLDNNSRKVGPSLAGAVATSSSGLDFGSSEFGGLIAPDPSGTGFIGWKKQSLTWKHYNPSTDVWTTLTKSTGSGASPQAGTPNMTDADTGRHAACCAIDAYGVMAFIQYNGGGAGADIWLYKHT